MPMPDEDDEGRTAFLRGTPPRAPKPDAPQSTKGPARLAIPIAALPKVPVVAAPPKAKSLSVREPVPSPRSSDARTEPLKPVRAKPEPLPPTVPEQTRAQIEASEAATQSPPARMASASVISEIPEDISLDNQPPVSVEAVPDTHSPPARSAPSVSAKPAKRETMTPETPGRYEMKREFGRGGQSSVWLALDRHIGRDVAFKQLLPHNQDPRQGTSNLVSSLGIRFLREARITGQLEHPSIVPVYEVGKRADGTFYYTQKLIRGRTFTDALKLCTNLGERLKMLSHFIQLCQAIAYAHKRGVIHRDIKPDNVMVGEFGETIVLDWGLAKQLNDGKQDSIDEEDLAKTQEGDVMGTPAYMSPEQAQGRKREIDGQSDIWSLGAVLYEIISGRPPFVGRNLMTMLIAVSKDPIPEPKEFEPHVPPELAAIAMKALTRPRDERYGSALDLIADVEAWRTGGRVKVYRYTPWGSAARWLKKNRAITITALCVIAALAVGSLRVAMENTVARTNLAQALLEKAAASSRDLEWGKAAVYAAAARMQEDTAEARFRTAHRGPVEIDPLLRVQLPGPIDKLALSPDGQLAAVAITGQGVHLVDPKGQDTHPLEGINEPVGYLAFSPEGNLLCVATGSNLLVFNASSGELEQTLEGTGPAGQVSFSPDGKKLAFATGKSARVYDVSDWKLLAQLDGHVGAVHAVAFAPDQSGIATSGEDGTLRLWTPVPQRAGQRVEQRMIRGPGHSPVTRLAFSPSGRILIPASMDGTVRFFDLDNGNQQVRIATNQGPVIDLAPAAEGMVAALGQDNSVVLIDALTQTEVAHLEGDDASTAVAISADGGRLASANRDGKLRLWKMTPGARVYGFESPSGFTQGASIAFSPSGKQVAAGDLDGHIQVWESANGKRTAAMALPAGPVSGLAWSPDGKLLAATGNDNSIVLFDIASGQKSVIEGATVNRALVFSPDGKTLASAGIDGQIHLWDPTSASERGSIPASNLVLNAVTFSRDGKLIGAAGDDKTAHVFDARSHKEVQKIQPAPDAILALAFSPHGSLVATGGRDQAVRTFRVSNGKLRSVWNGHGARIHSLSFTPDGQILASASADGSIRLWDVLTGRQVVRFERAPEPRALAFSADGKFLASVGEHPPMQLVELDDTKALLKPAAELDRQLALHKLRFEGILLVDDTASLQGKAWKAVPTVSTDESGKGAGEEK
jgi:WD40 repeat protein